jgi:hypothetical protein
MVFFINKKKETKKFIINGRVIVNAISFRERNSNYFFLKVDERSPEDNLFLEDNSLKNNFRNDREVTKKKTFYISKDLLLYSLTVYRFNFYIKR